jgi:phage FluMu gp28-like protein
LPRFFAGALDATGNGSYLAEVAMQRYGAERISCVSLTDMWYGVNLPPFKAAFEDEIIEIVRDTDHRNDIGTFKVINGIPKLPRAKTKSDAGGTPRHGDAGIAYLLGHFASRMPVQKYAYEPVKRDRTIKAGFKKRKQGVM